MTPQELKNSILQMAIQGKLVEQRPEEGTAEELYQQIQAEKQRLIKEKKIKKDKPLPEITEDEKPFDIPDSWKWVRVKEVSPITTGKKDANFGSEQGEYPFFTCAKNPIRCHSFSFDCNALLLAGNGDIGNIALYNGKFEAYQRTYVVVINKKIDAKFFLYVFLANWVKYNQDKIFGTAIPYIRLGNLEKFLIPLPPLAEQKRIVAKIEKLLPLIDQYEAAWIKLEAFNKRFPEDMQKSILQQAIQGKLVEQRPEEGTGKELYQQIQAKKQRLIKEKKIKKDKPLSEITDGETPFDIPDSWKWVRLPEVGELNRGKSKHRPRNDPALYVNGTVPFIQTGDVARSNGHITSWNTCYNEIGLEQSRLWEKGTICLTIAANIGDVSILDFDACFPDSVVGFNAYKPIESNEFFMYGLMCYKTILDIMSRSTAQKNINLEILSQIAFPLPPLAEQKRIVAKIEQLLPLCDKLK